MTNRTSVLAVAAVVWDQPFDARDDRPGDIIVPVRGGKYTFNQSGFERDVAAILERARAIAARPARRLLDDEFDDNREAIRNGDLAIYG